MREWTELLWEYSTPVLAVQLPCPRAGLLHVGGKVLHLIPTRQQAREGASRLRFWFGTSYE
jgi:hypothetical protein